MTTLEDDRADFVAARWPELEAVARVVLLDDTVARRVTTDVLADLASRWRDAVDDGRPGERARRALLRASVVAAERSSAQMRDEGAVPRPHRAPDEDDASGSLQDETDVSHALAAALSALPVLARATVAAQVLWDQSPEDVARLLGRPGAELAESAHTSHALLERTHEEARRAAGLDPAAWTLERDLTEAVHLLAGGLGDPPDPSTLVADRAGGLRRRRLLLGGAATLGLGAAAWWVSGAAGEGSGPSPGPSVPGPDDPVWDTTRRWPARGRLAADSDVQALVIRDAPRGTRLLWADEVGDRVVVVASPADISGRDGVRLVVWTGPRGAAPASLQPVSLARDSLPGVRDVVALVVPQDVGDALLVVGVPSLLEASYAAVVTPTPAGASVRSFTTMRLERGVGIDLVGRGLGPATYVSVGGFHGVPAGTPSVRPPILPNPSPDDFARSRREMVAELTGVPGGLLSTRVVLDSPVDGGVLDPDADASRRTGRVVVVRTLLPDDAVVRSVRVTVTGAGSQRTFDAEEAAVVPAEDADGPVVARLPSQTRTERFLVVLQGATRVRFLSPSSADRPVTRWVRCTGDAAVVTVPDARQEARYTLLAEDDRGREVFTGVPPLASELL